MNSLSPRSHAYLLNNFRKGLSWKSGEQNSRGPNITSCLIQFHVDNSCPRFSTFIKTQVRRVSGLKCLYHYFPFLCFLLDRSLRENRINRIDKDAFNNTTKLKHL